MARQNTKNKESSINESGSKFTSSRNESRSKGYTRATKGKPNTGRSGNSNIPDNLKRDIASFNWYKPVGTSVGARGWFNSVPVVAAIKVQPTLGITNSPSSPTNQMARIMYNYIVRINATTCPYEPVDLQMGILAVSELYKFTIWASRIYKYAQTYSIYNRAIPKLFFAAENISAEDILGNLTDYRAWLNNFMLKCGTLSFPGNLRYFQSIDELFTGVYVDEDTERAQFTIFSPHAFYKYDELGTEGGRLIPILPGFRRTSKVTDDLLASTPQHSNDWSDLGNPFAYDGELTFAKIKWIGEELLESLLRSEDICRICADIYKAYGTEKLLHFTMVNEDDKLAILYSDDMNTMIENAILVGRPEIDTQTTNLPNGNHIYAPVVTQNTAINGGNLQFTFYGMNRMGDQLGPLQKYFAEDFVYNVHNDKEVTADMMIDLARWTPTTEFVAYGSGTTSATVRVKSCGTEILTEAYTYSLNSNGSVIMNNITSSALMDDRGTVKDIFSTMAWINAFHHFPRVSPILTVTENGGPWYLENISFDKYAVIPQKDIEQIHDTYLLTQYQVPDYNYTAK